MQSAEPISQDIAIDASRNGNRSVFKFPAMDFITSERWLIGAHIGVALAAVAIGLLLGPLQTYRRAPGIDFDFASVPIFSYYYQALTAHGVLNALVFTTFFIMGSSYLVVQRALQRPLKSVQAAWVSFWLMFVGLTLTAGAIIMGEANVLYTFYAPMVASPAFYLGLTLVIVGTWIGAGNMFLTYFEWRRENNGQPVPLAVYAVIANFIMWCTATIGVAIEVLTMMLPLSLGWIDTTDAQVSRILFWFFGHPLVYFWLIPAYTSWYAMLPRQLGVRLFSDPLGRVAFLMLMIFSIPIGVHHLYVDPGVSEVAKLMHAMLTFVVAIPSFMTAFNLAATLERSGRKRGASGVVDWMWKQPWGDPVIASQLCGMLLFLFGGLTGIMNASFNMNVALHNTTWVVGHFHVTLGGGVFMTYIGMIYWMLPMLRGRRLWTRWLALLQTYTWFGGMLIFSGAMGRAGIEGAVRRSDVGAAGAYIPEGAAPWLNVTAIGGTVLFVSVIALLLVLIGTLFFSRQPADEREIPIATSAPKGVAIPAVLEKWRLWLVVIILSNIIMWGPVLINALDLTYGFWAVGNTASAR